MNPNIYNLLNKYADDHNKLQLDYYVISFFSNAPGFLGASTWFQIQAQGKVLHTRKIYNYLIDRDEILIVTYPYPLSNQISASCFKISFSIRNCFNFFRK